MARWDNYEEVDPLVVKEIEERIKSLSVEDTYFLYFILRHLKALKEFLRTIREYSL